VDRDRIESQAWADFAEGKRDEAVAQMRKLAEEVNSTFQASDQIPAREMLADMLLEMKQPDQALVEYQADLKVDPNRFDGLYGAARAAEMSGKPEQARGYYAQLEKQCADSGSQRPELAQARTVLHGE